MSRQTGETIQDFFNTIHDKVFNFKTVSEEDRKELSKLLNDYCGDHLFNEFVLKYFSNGSNAWSLKSSIQNIKTFPNVSLNSATAVLKDIFEHSQKENIKSYIKWLTFNVEDFLSVSQNEYLKLHLDSSLFVQFLETEGLRKYIKHFEFKPGFSLLSFICQFDDENKHVIPSLIKYGNVKIEWDKANSLDELFTQLLQNYLILNPENKLKGFNLNGSFINAVSLFNSISTSWDKLSATFNLRNNKLPDISMMGGYTSHLSDSDVVRIFAGEYNLVPTNEMQDKKVNVDVIADFDKFNQFSIQRRLQISHFLLTNRKRFNNIISDATQIIINNLRNKLEPNVISSAFHSQKHLFDSSLRDYNNNDYNKNDLENDVKTFISKLYKQIKTANPKTFDDGISFISHYYLPMLYQFKNRCNELYGANTTSNILSRFNNSEVLSIIGVSNNVQLNQNKLTSLNGGNNNNPIVMTKEKIVEKPVIKYIYKSTHNANTNEHQQIAPTPYIGGKSESNDDKTHKLVESLMVAQKMFNKLFEDSYKKLTNALNNTKPTQVQSQQVSKLIGICDQFESIGIRNAKTTIYLSGFYSAKNYNRLYAKYISNVIASIEQYISNGFEDVLKTLKQIQTIIDNSYKEAKEIKLKYTTSPKAVSESLVIVANKVKIPCQLTTHDFNAYDEAVRRIRNIILNSSVESSVYNIQQQVESYLSKINNREQSINEHYDYLVQQTKITFANDYKTVNRDFEYAKDIKINLINQKRNALLYLNKVLDVKLAKERLEIIQHTNLSNSQIETIEKAYLAFKNNQISSEFDKLMDSINKCIKSNTVGSIFKLIKKLRTLIVKSNYLQFIAQIYNELGLFSSSFNWSEFIDNYTTLIVVSSIDINRKYQLLTGTESHTKLTWLHKFAEKMEQYYLNIKPCTDTDPATVVKFSGITDVTSITYYQNLMYIAIYDVFVDSNVASTSTLTVGGLFNTSATALKTSGEFSRLITSRTSKYTEKKKPYYVQHSAILDKAVVTILNEANTKTSDFLGQQIELTNQWGIDFTFNWEKELEIADYSIESLITNVVTLIDKYWSIKYNGSLNLPLNMQTLMRGGSSNEHALVTGGGIFDSSKFHDQSNAQLIIEAVPFYICALHICFYYVSVFNASKTSNEKGYHLKLTISKLSFLYPIYEIFKKYHATLNTLTPQQLKICVSVFNEIWNQSQGNEATKLSRSIDILFSELNACFIFTDEIQYEIIKATNSLSKISVDIMNANISDIVKSIKEALVYDDKSGMELTNESDATYLENVLSSSLKEVKLVPESQRFAKLKAIISKDNDNGNLRDFFVFMELVVTPMLICAKSYTHIFSLFSYYKSTQKAYESSDLTDETLDLDTINIVCKDVDPKTGAITTSLKNAWTIIQDINNGNGLDLKIVFMESPIVLKYNKILLHKALFELHKTGQFKIPNFWIVLDENTYPQQSKIEFKETTAFNECNSIELLRQIYPTVHAQNLGDYYNHAIVEMMSDYDHFIHAFLAYPGLSDKAIKKVTELAHDSIKISNLDLDEKDSNRFSATKVYGINVKEENKSTYYTAINEFSEIKIAPKNYYLFPPSMNETVMIPKYSDINIYEDISFTTYPSFTYLSNQGKQAVLIEGTNIFAVINYNFNERKLEQKIGKCAYTWLDWVLYSIAKCDKINFMIPYKFLQMLQDYPGISPLLKTVVYNRKDQSMIYARDTNGVYYNIVSQNIIARSSVLSNKEKTEISSLNTAWIANLVSVIPYIINTLTAYHKSMTRDVSYNNVNVSQSIGYLIDVLTSFYDIVINYAPFIPFMNSLVQLNSSIAKPHLFAELLQLLVKNNLASFDISDFVKIEWANKYFFNYIDNIQFPEYKHKNRFEWINEYAQNQLVNGAFKTEFDTSIQILGKLSWSCLISETFSILNSNSMDEKLDELIIYILHTMSECDMALVQRFITNVINEQKTLNSTVSLTGGNMKTNDTPIQIIDDDDLSFISRITKGIVDNVKTVDERLVDLNNRVQRIKNTVTKLQATPNSVFNLGTVETEIKELEGQLRRVSSSTDLTHLGLLRQVYDLTNKVTRLEEENASYLDAINSLSSSGTVATSASAKKTGSSPSTPGSSPSTPGSSPSTPVSDKVIAKTALTDINLKNLYTAYTSALSEADNFDGVDTTAMFADWKEHLIGTGTLSTLFTTIYTENITDTKTSKTLKACMDNITNYMYDTLINETKNNVITAFSSKEINSATYGVMKFRETANNRADMGKGGIKLLNRLPPNKANAAKTPFDKLFDESTSQLIDVFKNLKVHGTGKLTELQELKEPSGVTSLKKIYADLISASVETNIFKHYANVTTLKTNYTSCFNGSSSPNGVVDADIDAFDKYWNIMIKYLIITSNYITPVKKQLKEDKALINMFKLSCDCFIMYNQHKCDETGFTYMMLKSIFDTVFNMLRLLVIVEESYHVTYDDLITNTSFISKFKLANDTTGICNLKDDVETVDGFVELGLAMGLTPTHVDIKRDIKSICNFWNAYRFMVALKHMYIGVVNGFSKIACYPSELQETAANPVWDTINNIKNSDSSAITTDFKTTAISDHLVLCPNVSALRAIDSDTTDNLTNEIYLNIIALLTNGNILNNDVILHNKYKIVDAAFGAVGKGNNAGRNDSDTTSITQFKSAYNINYSAAAVFAMLFTKFPGNGIKYLPTPFPGKMNETLKLIYPIYFGSNDSKYFPNVILTGFTNWALTGGNTHNVDKSASTLTYMSGGLMHTKEDLVKFTANSIAVNIYNRAIYQNISMNQLHILYNSEYDFPFMLLYNRNLAKNNTLLSDEKYMEFMKTISKEGKFITDYQPQIEVSMVYKDLLEGITDGTKITSPHTNPSKDETIDSKKYEEIDLSTVVKPISSHDKLNIFELTTGKFVNAYTHHITIPPKLFQHIDTMYPVVQQYMFSPQKDIYNVTCNYTTDTDNTIHVPVILDFTTPSSASVNFYNPDYRWSILESNKYIVNVASYNPIFDKTYLNREVVPNVIYYFIRLLLSSNLNNLFTNSAINNYGFKTNYLSGGLYVSPDNIIKDIIDLDNVGEGATISDKLQTAYKIKHSDTPLDSSALLSSRLYTNLIGPINIKLSSNTTYMTKLIIKYFHKYNISFNSIFNQICFPSIIYNSSCFRVALSRLHTILESNKSILSTDASSKAKSPIKSTLLKFILTYLYYYTTSSAETTNPIINTLDASKYMVYQVKKENRNTDMPINSFVDNFADIQYKIGATNSPEILLANQFMSPSVANAFMIELSNYISSFVKTDNKYGKKTELTRLFSSNVISALRQLDSITSFVSILFMLLKQTSYYDNDANKDVSYFSGDSPEPFSVN